MELVKSLSLVGRNDVGFAGGKGVSLGVLTQGGVPVPPGYVILSNAFERFLQETDLNVEIDGILTTVNLQVMSTVENASEKIQELILSKEIPLYIEEVTMDYFRKLGATYVAVRSSATAEDGVSAAWAGQLDTFLNTTENSLFINVRRCWASLFTSRAILYRFEKGLHMQKISVAVVVQKMVESEYSGVAFSVHPVTEDRNQLIIEAGFGLGEAMVSGLITPDSYVVKKSSREIISVNLNTQNKALYRAQGGGTEWKDLEESQVSAQVLSIDQIKELSDLVVQIEGYCQFPCDIEWAYEAGKFYITQSRPITTLSSKV